MKALTLTEPWATLMRMGEKNIETRSWRTNYRGMLAIHAAKNMPGYAKEFCRNPEVIAAFFRQERQPWFRPGVILCVRELVDCVPIETVGHISPKEKAFGDYSPGRFAWIFSSNVRVISPAVPAKGSLGLWDWEP